MQGLMLKLLNVDAAGERALRVVSYFDQLLVHQPNLESVVRASAILADCPVGLVLPRIGLRLRFGPDGIELGAGAPPADSNQLAIDGPDDREGGLVWLEREGSHGDLDDFILERMALTVAGVLMRSAPLVDVDLATGLSDPALAQLLVNEKANEAERSRAARLMGIDQSSHIQLVAVQSDFSRPSYVERLAADLRAGWKRQAFAAQMSKDVVIVVAIGRDPVSWDAVSVEGRAASSGVVEVLEAPEAWRQARVALRFAGLGSAWPNQLDAAQVGVLSVLPAIDPAAVRADPDVRRIESLAAAPGGAESIRILDIVLHSETLRSAAREANFHHSSIQSRLAGIEKRYGLTLRTGRDRQRLSTALLLWQLNR
jgi:hypothetical protein